MISIMFLGSIYWVAETFFPQTSSELIPKNDALSARFISGSSLDGNSQNVPQKAHSNATKEKIVLALDRKLTIGKSIIVYRGLDDNAKFRMDIAMLELDPNAFYRYRVPIKAAKKGFRLVGQKFKLISARKSAIQFWHLKNSRRSHWNQPINVVKLRAWTSQKMFMNSVGQPLYPSEFPYRLNSVLI